jgi:hypothetical protein
MIKFLKKCKLEIITMIIGVCLVQVFVFCFALPAMEKSSRVEKPIAIKSLGIDTKIIGIFEGKEVEFKIYKWR